MRVRWRKTCSQGQCRPPVASFVGARRGPRLFLASELLASLRLMPASTHPAECPAPPFWGILRPHDPRPAGSTRKNSGVGDYYAPSNQAKSSRVVLTCNKAAREPTATTQTRQAQRMRRGEVLVFHRDMGCTTARSPWRAFTLLAHFPESLFGMLDGAVSSYSLPLAPYPFFSFHTSSVQPPGSRVRSSSSILSSSLLFS